ncbi:MAG: hypothetical protein ACXVB9_18830 [Bdellovibrionota bacterium]
MKMQFLAVLMLAGLVPPAGAAVPAFTEILQSPELQKAVGNEAESVTVHAAVPGSNDTRFVVSAQYPTSSCAFDVSSDRGQVSVRPLGCAEDAMFVPDVTATPPSFAKDIQPIFKARCTMCHGPGKMRPEDFSNYQTAVGMKEALVQRVLTKKDMPMGVKLDSAALSLIDAWVKAGTPQ